MNFPKIVLCRDDGSLHPNYRSYEDEGLNEFEYFCDRILSRLRPRDTKYKERKTKEPLSAIFTPSDEAFALMILYNELDRWENIPDPDTLEAMEVSKKRKWKNTVEKKFCSSTRGCTDGWEEEGKQMYYKLVKNIEELRKDPIKGGGFEKRLMVKWVSEKMGMVGGNMSAVTYSTFEEDNSGFKPNDEDLMMETGVYQEMLADYEEVLKEEEEKNMDRPFERYIATEVSGRVKNV